MFAIHGGAIDQEVCDVGSWKSVEVMKKHLRGVPFSRTATIANRLAASVDGGLRLTTRQGALVDRRGNDDLESDQAPSIWRHAATGLLHEAGREGKLGCGAVASPVFTWIAACASTSSK